MLWHGMDHFDNTGEPMPVNGSTEEMLELFDISPTEQNQFVFNQSAKYVTIICRTFHPVSIMEHHILRRCKDSTKLQADEALTMVAKLHGCMPSDAPTLTYSRDYGVSWEYHLVLVSKLLQFKLCIVQFTSQYYFII
jgi:hypothetical protein